MKPAHGMGEDPLDGFISQPGPPADKSKAKGKGVRRRAEPTNPATDESKAKGSRARQHAEPTNPTPPRKTPKVAPPKKKAKRRKQKQTYSIDADVASAARNAADALQGPPARLTLTAIVEEALRREVARLECQYNDGRPFAEAGGNLRPGRRVGGS